MNGMKKLYVQPGIKRLYTDGWGRLGLHFENIFRAYSEPDTISGMKYYFDIHEDNFNSLIVEADDCKGKYRLKSDPSVSLNDIKYYLCRIYSPVILYGREMMVFCEKDLESAEKELVMQLSEKYKGKELLKIPFKERYNGEEPSKIVYKIKECKN